MNDPPAPTRRTREDTAKSRASRVVLGVAVFAGCFVMGASARAEVRRDPLDEQELAKLETTCPRAVALLEQGEALASEGKLADADALFQQGIAEAKTSSILLRRHCEALTALGRRSEAVPVCYQAMQELRSTGNVRATIRSLVWGPTAASWSDIGLALDLAHKERQRAPHLFAPIAATCDIAASLGDQIMLQRCATELEEIAPDAAETRRAMALLSPGCPPWLFWMGWGSIAAAALLTLGDAVRRGVRRASSRRAGRSVALVQTMLCVALSLPCAAHAEPAQPAANQQDRPTNPSKLSKWPINDDDPESSIPSAKDLDADPMEAGYFLQDLIYHAEIYAKHGKHETAAKLYLALAKAAPERAIAFSKLCDEYEAMGKLDKAVGACRAAVMREGVLVQDYEHFVRVVLATPGPLGDTPTKELAMVLTQLQADPNGRSAVEPLRCEIAVRMSNRTQLEQCTTRLAATAPNDPRTISYEWALAMITGRLDEAGALVDSAKAAGFKADGIAHMQAALSEAVAGRHRARIFYTVAATVLLLAAAGVAAMAVMRKGRAVQPKAATTA